MSKFYASAALLSLLLMQAPAFADDTPAAADAPAAKTAGGKHGHEHVPGKKAVLELSSLTDKQRAPINAIYDDNKVKWDDIRKQMKDLTEAEWAKVKPLLTADQITELESQHGGHHGGGHHGKKDAGAAPATAPSAAPADSSK